MPPAELEALLLSHQDVLDAAVVGLPDAHAGELPLAYVVPRPNSRVTPRALQDFVKREYHYIQISFRLLL